MVKERLQEDTERLQSDTVRYNLAIGSYKREQAKLKAIIHAALKDYKKPKLSLEQLSKRLGKKLADTDLSAMVTDMRESGY